jgi:hypothetical protein
MAKIKLSLLGSSMAKQRSLFSYCRERDALLFSLKTSFIVGTILTIINHGRTIISFHFTSGQIVPLFLTYCVPFIVAIYSRAQGKQQHDLVKIQPNHPEDDKALSCSEELSL